MAATRRDWIQVSMSWHPGTACRQSCCKDPWQAQSLQGHSYAEQLVQSSSQKMPETGRCRLCTLVGLLRGCCRLGNAGHALRLKSEHFTLEHSILTRSSQAHALRWDAGGSCDCHGADSHQVIPCVALPCECQGYISFCARDIYAV